MIYTLLYTKSAVDDIHKLDTVAKKRIKKKLEEYALNPFLFAKKLVNSAIGTHRWRVGDYRIIFDIDGVKIIILRIGHRKEIYRQHTETIGFFIGNMV